LIWSGLRRRRYWYGMVWYGMLSVGVMLSVMLRCGRGEVRGKPQQLNTSTDKSQHDMEWITGVTLRSVIPYLRYPWWRCWFPCCERAPCAGTMRSNGSGTRYGRGNLWSCSLFLPHEAGEALALSAPMTLGIFRSRAEQGRHHLKLRPGRAAIHSIPVRSRWMEG